MSSVKVVVDMGVSQDQSYVEIKMQTEDGSPLDPQGIIDIISDYLLVDPENLFAKRKRHETPTQN